MTVGAVHGLDADTGHEGRPQVDGSVGREIAAVVDHPPFLLVPSRGKDHGMPAAVIIVAAGVIAGSWCTVAPAAGAPLIVGIAGYVELALVGAGGGRVGGDDRAIFGGDVG